jgi:hypothetical protein
MHNYTFKFFVVLFSSLLSVFIMQAQSIFVFSGKVTDSLNRALPNATVHLAGIPGGTITKADGTFTITSSKWANAIEVTHAGFERVSMPLVKSQITGLNFQLKQHVSLLNDVVVTVAAMDKEPGKRFMKKVIAAKNQNNPDRFSSYSYRQYKRHELLVNNLDSVKRNNKGLKNLAINIYRSTDSANTKSTQLPVYFSETISNKYHAIFPAIEKENILAKKTLGLQTDNLLRKLDKFNFNFNVYDNWLIIFSQTYASPLSSTAFDYYNFYFSDSSLVNGKKQYRVHFAPRQKFERAFTGSLWINDSSFSISKIDMHLSKTANLNFINDIHYTQEYAMSFDSATKQSAYMPFKYTAAIDFETGAALIGIPAKAKEKTVRLIANNTVVIDHIQFAGNGDAAINKMNSEATVELEKDDAYWTHNRPDSLSRHERNIYIMADSLKRNTKYKNDTRLIAALGIGYWDVQNKLRFGPLTSIISSSVAEGMRSRVGFWTLPGISKKLNVNGYLAYGTKDKRLKSHLALQYLWNPVRWSKTSISGTNDYNYPIEKDDESDDDNILTSLVRKKVPSTNIFVRSIALKHEQYISKNITAKLSLEYKELRPVFHFTYHPIDKVTDQPIDSVNSSRLPVAESSIGFRFAKNQRTAIFNYNRVMLDNYNPVVTFNFIYGIETGNAQFAYEKINAGLEQRLRLPPKAIFYYKLNVGKTFGTAPYLLLDVPAGNESHMDSRYLFNTMLPYEYAADQFMSLHTRLYTGGTLFDKIPLLNKMGWRERFSFNAFMGSMTDANKTYNNNAQFSVTGNKPFMETGVGIENIFHLLSLDYFWRLTPGALDAGKGGLFVGLKVAF